MVNLMKVKKWGLLSLVGVLPLGIFNLFLISGWGMLWAILGAIISLILGIVLFSFFYSHPLIKMAEGEGLLVLTIDSTGVIKPYIAKIEPPYIHIKSKKGLVSTIFDRKVVSYLKIPEEVKATKEENDKYEIINLKIPKDKKHYYTFAMDSYPVLIYNRNLQTFLSKETLSKLEMDSSIKHLVFYLKKKVEELTSIMRDFARYVIEMSKPRPAFGFLSSWWFWIIVIIAIVILAILFLPNIMQTFNPVVNTIKQTTPVK